MKKNYIYFLLCCVCCISLWAQKETPEIFHIKGILIDSLTHKSEPYATVCIREIQNPEKVIKMSITNNYGEFNISLFKPGTYLLLFTSIGMKDVKKEVKLYHNKAITDVGTIYTCDDIQNLKNITVVSRRKLIKIDIDKLEYNVENDPNAAVSSTFEILKKVPFVTVNVLDQVKLNGTGNFKVYIDGHSSITVNTQNLAEVLKNIPANTIKSIQVITNPDAKYDAEGIAGILNIVRRKGTPGYSVSLSGGITNTSQYGRIYSTVQSGKIAISGNVSLVHSNAKNSYIDNEYINYQSSNDYKQISHNDQKLKSGGATTDDIEISYDIDSLRLFSFAAGVMASYDPVNVNGTTKMYASDGSLAFSYDKNSRMRNSLHMIIVQSNYQRLFHRKGEMVVLSYQLSTLPHLQKTYTNYTNITNYSFPYTAIYRKENPNTIENTIQMDYTDPITSKQTIEAGMKYIIRHNKSNNLYYNRNDDDDYAENADQCLYYSQTQNVYALYGEYVLKEKNWSVKGGVRYEYTHENINETGGVNDCFTNHYGNFVPSASAFWNINENNNLKLSYTMRISRPDISSLNPRIINDDPLNIYYGNSSLSCEKSNSLNVEYNYTGEKASINFSSGYSFIDNSIEPYTFATDGILNHTYRNIGHFSNTWISIYTEGDIIRHLHGRINANWTYNQYRNIQSGINRRGSCYTVDCSLGQPLLWHITANADGSWNSSSVTSQGKVSGTSSYGISLRRSFINKKLTVSLSANNFLQKYKRSSYWNEDDTFRFQSTTHSMYRSINLKINYYFGKLKRAIPRVTHTINNIDLKKVNAN